MTEILVGQSISIALSVPAPEVFQSCILLPPAAPPPAPVNDVIYTPVAPGIVYESLPIVTIIDTSPDQIIGCIHDTASNPQIRLNALFPSAVDGDGVIERRNNDIWVYDGALWNNVGPTPGPTVQMAQPLILPYNETAIYNGILRTRLDITKFDYSLQLFTEINPVIIKLRLDFARVLPSVVHTLSCLSPVVTTDTALQVPTIPLVMAARRPYANDLKISVPVVTFNLLTLVPGSGDISIPIPSAAFTIQVLTPSVYTEVNVGAIAYSQSSVYTGTTPASVAIMTDGIFTNTGSATDSGTDEWVQMDLGAVISISNIIIGTATGSIPGGWDRTYTENRDIEYSEDATSWTLAFNTDTFAADGIYTFAVNIKARYIRITTAVFDWTAISEFYALAPGQSYP